MGGILFAGLIAAVVYRITHWDGWGDSWEDTYPY